MRRTAVFVLVLGSVGLSTGCGQPGDDEDAARPRPTTTTTTFAPSRPDGLERFDEALDDQTYLALVAAERAEQARASRRRQTTTTAVRRPRSTGSGHSERRGQTTKQANPTGDVRTVNSTGYCLRSQTANGGRGYVGSVAMNGVPFGSRWRVVGTGAIYTVNDRIGHSSQFDIWFPSCPAAINYGRRTITVERVG